MPPPRGGRPPQCYHRNRKTMAQRFTPRLHIDDHIVLAADVARTRRRCSRPHGDVARAVDRGRRADDAGAARLPEADVTSWTCLTTFPPIEEDERICCIGMAHCT